MKVQIERVNQAVHMLATNEDGNQVSIDGSLKAGGENAGFRPMQLLLAGIGSCSAIDVIDILKKQRQELEDIKVEVRGDREEGEAPNLFKSVYIHFSLKGALDEKKVKKAIDLSMQKYCSVARILEKTAELKYDFSINK